ncbi:MAG: N-acetyl-gamma-glutamyl-phosphate reductase [Deltaproteobacteria bacterium]|nr:N-acetyl-gamma-glutamyl-phosphate reductase [Deltaproteobacteria bacterium]
MTARVGIIGATGYTGMELIRILLRHPEVDLTYVTSRKWAGKHLSEVSPALSGRTGLRFRAFDASEARMESDLVFVCLPHGGAMDASAALIETGVRTVDLSADFRLRERKVYEEWYGPHSQVHLLRTAVNGFPELYRDGIRDAFLVANAGCYPTSIILGLVPLVEKGLLKTSSVIADSKSGVSGAGREPKEHLHFPEVEGNFSAYGIAGVHRHTPEIDQELTRIGGKEIRVTFTPHLLPVSRGILSTIYADPAGSLEAEAVCDLYKERYRDEPFVQVRGNQEPLPTLKEVRGTNMCVIAPRIDRGNGRIIVISCLDNLVKGASGQAVQNMNIMLGLPETLGLLDLPIVP